MESLEMLDDGGRVLENGVYSFDDEAERMDSFSENLGVDILEDLDSYMEDIKERLIISRMVSDSVIKGIVNAVEEESAEKIASKDLELANLKDLLNRFRVRDSLQSLKNAACQEFKKLKQEICSVRKFGFELVGNSKENGNLSWDYVDKTLENLESVVQTICSSENSIKEMDFRREVEAMVIQSSIRSIQEEFEAKFWDQNKNFSGYEIVNWLEKFEEISCLRKELDTVLKLLPNQETSQLISHGSCDFDHSNTPSLHESNSHNNSKTRIHDKYDAAKFGHMTNKELVNFFNTTIIELRREHESIVQEKTEEYYDLKKRYLNERGSSLPLKKDKGSDVLRKRIPEVIVKLDNILEENKRNPVLSDDFESISTLKYKLDNLLSENHQLRDLITDKKTEVKCLSLQVSEHSLNEAYLGKLVENLQLDIEDAKVEASVCEDIYKCVLQELTESQNEGKLYQESKRIGEYDEILDLAMKNLIMQSICEVIYEEKAKELLEEVLIVNASQVELEKVSSKMEHEFQLILQEKEKSTDNLLAELKNVNEQLESSSQELHKLRDEVNLQQSLIFERSEELDVVKAKLSDAVDQGNVHRKELNGLNEKIKLAMEELKKADDAKKLVLALSREKDNVLLQFKAQKDEHAKKIESLVALVNDFSKKIAMFESKVNQDIEDNNSRLKNSRNELNYVRKKVSDVARTDALYKQKLEKRCTDLKIAEEEVDLLGDEVETLLSLLEKIYIALDHYSPILKHYPAIIEILKLVRKELCGERTKSF